MASTGSCIGSDESPISANATQPACGCNASREHGDSGLGTLTMRGERSQYLGAIPFDSVWHVSAMMISGDFRFICLHGATMFRVSARINSISFYREFDVEDT